MAKLLLLFEESFMASGPAPGPNDLIGTVRDVGDIVDPGQGPLAVEFFDYFFSDNLGTPANAFNGFIQWNVTGGSVDLVGGIGPGVFGAPPEQPAGRYVDLGGSTGDPGRFETRLAYPVVAGQTYNFTFDYRSTGGDLNSATAFVGDQQFNVSTSATSFQRFSANFTATETGAVRITFQGNEADTDNSGIGVDGILFGPVVGQGGSSTLATPASDFLTGSSSPDTISLLAGNDTYAGGGGADLIYGNQGSDLLLGNQGDDTIYGGQDADRIVGGQDADRLFGNLGTDVIYGNQGADIVYGNEAADMLFGGQGNDVLYGGQSDDTLVGGIGDDTLVGGLGADLYRFEANSGRDVIQGFNQTDGDRLNLGGQTYTLSSAQDGNAQLTLSGGGVVDLVGIQASQVSTSFFAA
jgi:Ca2+-binding RTX toxin-like protein